MPHTFRDGTIDYMENFFFDCIKSRKDPNAPVEAEVAAARRAYGEYCLSARRLAGSAAEDGFIFQDSCVVG